MKYVIRASKVGEKIFTNKEKSSSFAFHDIHWIILNESGVSASSSFFPSVGSTLECFIQTIGTAEGIKEITIQTEKS